MAEPQATAVTNSHLQEKREELLRRREEHLGALTQAARERQTGRMRGFFREVCQTNEFLESLDRIAAETRPRSTSGRPRFAVSSLFLHDCLKKLTPDKDEYLFFVTGSEIDGVFVLSQLLEFACLKRSMLGVEGDPRATHALLIKLEQYGHRLLAHFHSHPGTGAEATGPSGIDENFQERLERAGHVAVCGIFSRDGFIRFLRLDKNFELEIYGNGVEKHEANVYRLRNLG